MSYKQTHTCTWKRRCEYLSDFVSVIPCCTTSFTEFHHRRSLWVPFFTSHLWNRYLFIHMPPLLLFRPFRIICKEISLYFSSFYVSLSLVMPPMKTTPLSSVLKILIRPTLVLNYSCVLLHPSAINSLWTIPFRTFSTISFNMSYIAGSLAFQKWTPKFGFC